MEKLNLNYDVCIIGGGVAGIAAALASTRSNKKTILVEASYMVGGLATSGLVSIYLPFDDGYGHQISYGLCEELFNLSMSKGYEDRFPKAWMNNASVEEKSKERLEIQFNPQMFSILCEDKLVNEKVKILYGCIVRDVIVENSKILKVIGSTRTQDIEIKAKSFVDCTGDATICEKAGLPTNFPTKGNVRANWFYSVENGKYKLNLLGSCDYVYTDNKEYRWFKGIDSQELSEIMVKSHKEILNKFLKKGNGTKEHAIATIPTIPEIRMTRKLVGDYKVKSDENDKIQPHSIGLISYWAEKGINYEIPAEILFNSAITNLYVAGRCISVLDDIMWNVTRAIPGCVVTGEASGYLAANFANNKNINFEKVQFDLRKRNVKIHLSEIDFKN